MAVEKENQDWVYFSKASKYDHFCLSVLTNYDFSYPNKRTLLWITEDWLFIVY